MLDTHAFLWVARYACIRLVYAMIHGRIYVEPRVGWRG